jgi:hypothetical protein
MNWLLMFNGLVVGGCIGGMVGNYFDLGMTMTFLVASLGGAAGLGVAWRLQGYWD